MRYYPDLMTAWRMVIVGSTVMSVVLASDFARAEESFRGSSEIKGITVAPVSVLPAAPVSARKRTDCEDLVIKPKTPAGQLVAAKGWAVTGEVKVGNYTAVSFVGKLEFVSSSRCNMTRGNIGIFSDRLLAIAYTKEDDDQIGWVEQSDGGARLYDGGAVSGEAVADLKLTSTGELLLTPVEKPKFERITCEGTFSSGSGLAGSSIDGDKGGPASCLFGADSEAER